MCQDRIREPHEALIRLGRKQHDETTRSERSKMFADKDGASPRCSEAFENFVLSTKVKSPASAKSIGATFVIRCK